MIDPGRERRIGCMLVGGAALAILSLVLMLVVFMGGVSYAASPFGGSSMIARFAWVLLVPLVGGLVLVMLALGFGIRGGFAGQQASKRQRVEDCVILARFAEDPYRQRLFSEADIDPDICMFYVHVARPDGRRMELKTNWDLFRTLGEGTTGTIEHQGDWLGGFVPAPRGSEQQEPPKL